MASKKKEETPLAGEKTDNHNLLFSLLFHYLVLKVNYVAVVILITWGKHIRGTLRQHSTPIVGQSRISKCAEPALHISILLSGTGTYIHASIHPFINFLSLCCRGSSLSKESQTSLSLATSSSFSGGLPRGSQDRQDIYSLQCVLGLPKGFCLVGHV